MRHKLNFILVCFFLVSCGPSVQYIGKSYEPTSHIDIYNSASDVKKTYEIIGKADGRAWQLTDYDKIKKSIMKEAKKKGADAVIFTGLTTALVGTPGNTSTNTSTAHIQNVVSADFIRYH